MVARPRPASKLTLVCTACRTLIAYFVFATFGTIDLVIPIFVGITLDVFAVAWHGVLVGTGTFDQWDVVESYRAHGPIPLGGFLQDTENTAVFTGVCPAPRTGHSAAVWDGKVLYFGGFTGPDNTPTSEICGFYIMRRIWASPEQKLEGMLYHRCISD